MGSSLSKKLAKAMKSDVEFLRSKGLMDYSMLVGLEIQVKRDTILY